LVLGEVKGGAAMSTRSTQHRYFPWNGDLSFEKIEWGSEEWEEGNRIGTHRGKRDQTYSEERQREHSRYKEKE
jgi:hypothetical protein